MRDTFHTITYRGIYIHSFRDTESPTGETFGVNSPIDGMYRLFHTLRSAKLACTRIVRAIADGAPIGCPWHMATQGEAADKRIRLDAPVGTDGVHGAQP